MSLFMTPTCSLVHPAHLKEEVQVQEVWPKPRLQHLAPPSGLVLAVPFDLCLLRPSWHGWCLVSLLTPVPVLLLGSHPLLGAWWQPPSSGGSVRGCSSGEGSESWRVRWLLGDRISLLWAQVLSLLLLLPPRFPSSLKTITMAIRYPWCWAVFWNNSQFISLVK